MPLEQFPLPSPINVRSILASINVPLRSNDGQPVTIDTLCAATPMLRRTGAQIARANMMDKAISQAAEAKVLIHQPLETERIVGLYFCAKWCKVSRNFTPQLMATYSELRKQNRDFEIVLCSLDNKPEEYLAFSKTMPWLRLPFRDARITQLAREFGIKDKHLPVLVLVRAQDNGLIARNARPFIPYDPLGKKFPWCGFQPAWYQVLWGGLGSSGRAGVCAVTAWSCWKFYNWREEKQRDVAAVTSAVVIETPSN